MFHKKAVILQPEQKKSNPPNSNNNEDNIIKSRVSPFLRIVVPVMHIKRAATGLEQSEGRISGIRITDIRQLPAGRHRVFPARDRKRGMLYRSVQRDHKRRHREGAVVVL